MDGMQSMRKRDIVLWASFAACFAELAAALLFCATHPKISLQMGAPTDRANVLSSPAILSNDGLFPIFDVSMTCTGPGMVVGEKAVMNFPGVSTLNRVAGVATRLEGGRYVRVSNICMNHAVERSKKLDAQIRVDFKPLFLPQSYQEFRVTEVRQ